MIPRPCGRGELEALVRRHGWNATSAYLTRPGAAVFRDGTHAAVAYVDTGRAWVAAGAPVCAVADLAGTVERFAAAAGRAGRLAVFFGVEARLLEAAPSLSAVRVGRQPVWDPRAWPGTVSAHASLRAQIRRPVPRGVRARVVPREGEGEAAAALAALVARWRASRRMAPMGFLVDPDLRLGPERRCVLAERDGRLVGACLAVPVYARGGWYLETLVRDPDAPNGTAELLVDTAMGALAREGARYVTLGLAPLDGPVDAWLRAARALGRGLYDFEGLARFKAKLRPHRWDPIYVAFGGRGGGARAILEVLRAFAGGSLTRFAARTLAHRARQRYGRGRLKLRGSPPPLIPIERASGDAGPVQRTSAT